MGKQKGSGSGGGTQTTTSKTEVPYWIQNQAIKNLNQAQWTSDSLMKPFEGQRVADMPAGMQQLISQLQGNVGSTNGGYAAAAQGATNAMNYKPQQVSAPGSSNTPLVNPQQVQGQNVAAGTVNPAMTSVGQVDPAMAQGSTVSADKVNPTQVSTGNVSANQITPGFLSGTDLSSYMNPYTQNVIDAGTKAIDVQRQQAQNQNGDAAIRANAFGGSRHGVVEGVTNAEAARQAGEMTANLQNQNFLQARQAAESDINRNMQAQQTNQAANLQADTFNQQLGLQGQLANQSANMQGQLANQQTGLQAGLANQQNGLQTSLANQNAANNAQQFNQQSSLASQQLNQQAGLQGQLANQDAALKAGLANQANNMQGQQLNQAANLQGQLANQAATINQDQFGRGLNMQGQLANQNAGLQGAGLNLSGAQQLANSTGQGQQSWLQGIMSALSGQGMLQNQQQQQLSAQQQAYNEQRMHPVEQLNILTGALGMTPYGTETTQTSPKPESNGLMQGLGAASSIVGTLGGLFGPLGLFSDPDAKTDKEKLGTDPNTGLDIWAYRYKGDPKSYPKVIGPMADDIEKKFPGSTRRVGGKMVVPGSNFLAMAA